MSNLVDNFFSAYVLDLEIVIDQYSYCYPANINSHLCLVWSSYYDICSEGYMRYCFKVKTVNKNKICRLVAFPFQTFSLSCLFFSQLPAS